MNLRNYFAARNQRRFCQSTKRGDSRTPFQHDRDRIIYTQAFRRLAGVTQTSPSEVGFEHHNRLTHVLEVAQVGRRLAERLIRHRRRLNLEDVGGVDADVVEAACLAHDLGHPPFGRTSVARASLAHTDAKEMTLTGLERS